VRLEGSKSVPHSVFPRSIHGHFSRQRSSVAIMPTNVDLQNDPFLTHSTPVATQMDPTRTQALQSRRQMGSATQLQRKYNRRNWASKLSGAKDSPAWMFLTGAVLPTAMFIVIVALFTFDFVIPAFAWAIVLILLIVFAYLSWPNPPVTDYQGVPTETKRTAWQWFPIGVLIFSCIAGYIFGGINYYIFMLPYLHYTYNREYTNINPGEDAAGYQDAGALYFSAAARVNFAQSVGFLEWNRFCVAPIVGDDPSDTVSFFAAGVDCCESRHNFNCWDAKDSSVHSGVRISETDPLGRSLPQFKKAAAMAASVYGFKSSEDPVLVMWVRDPSLFAESTFWMAMIFLLVSGLVGLCGMGCCVTGLHKLRAV